MAIPDVTTVIRDGALGIVDPTDATAAVVGTCAGGTINTVYAFTEPTSLQTTLLGGPAVEMAAHMLAIGGGTVYVVRCDNTSAPGTFSAVVKVGTGASVLTLTGSVPRDSYQAIVTIVTGGANPASGLVTFKYTLDGGDTTSAEIALPTSGIYAIPNTGVTLTFSAATLVAADTYTFSTTEPGYNTSELNTALDALCADSRTWKFVSVVGAASSAANQATVATAVGAKMTTAETNYRFTYAILGMPDLGDGTTGDSASIAAFLNFAHSRVAVCAGFCELVSAVTGRVHKRCANYAYSARRHAADVSEDASRVRSGSLPGVSKLWRDEQVHRGLDAARFVTLRTIIGKQGYFVTNGRMMASVGSDFSYVQHREIMDLACTVGRAALIEFLGDDLRVNPSTHPTLPGAIDERDARAIDANVGGKVKAIVLAPGHVSGVDVRTIRTDNIISTSLLRAQIRITPKGYARAIEGDFGFVNPALAALES